MQTTENSIPAGESLVLTIHGVKFTFRYCPPGEFMMGSPKDEEGRYDHENLHKVVLTQGFWLLSTPVTNKMWDLSEWSGTNNNQERQTQKRLWDLSGWPVGNDNLDRPAKKSWCECRDYVEELNRLGVAPYGWTFSLPTEAQWEYACRAGTREARYAELEDIAKDYRTLDSGVWMKTRNAWGFYDMLGYVNEWCNDDWTHKLEDATDPLIIMDGVYASNKVYRGGSYYSLDFASFLHSNRNYLFDLESYHNYYRNEREKFNTCRSAWRSSAHPNDRHFSAGFRLALIPKESTSEVVIFNDTFDPVFDEEKVEGTGYQAGTARSLVIEDVVINFRWIPDGSFVMGTSNKGEKSEQNLVRLTSGFWLQATPITQEIWESIMGENPCQNKNPRSPVENVSWNDCQLLIAKLQLQGIAPAGWRFSLPTEAQWEYACRAGDLDASADKIEERAWGRDNSTGSSQQVGARRPNAWGLYDMLGNVQEWCDDAFELASQRRLIDPRGKVEKQERALRGGSYCYNCANCRFSTRELANRDERRYSWGVRLALVPISEPYDGVDQFELIASHGYKQGFVDGIEDGRQKGNKEGADKEREETRRQTILYLAKLLQARFGTNDRETIKLLENKTLEELNPLFTRAMRLPELGNILSAQENKLLNRNIDVWNEGIVRHGGTEYLLTIADVPYAFRWIPPGEFVMGSPENEKGRRENEVPRKVRLTCGFWMLSTPITQRKWESVTGKNPSKFKDPDRPVENISWFDCQNYIEQLNEIAPIPAGWRFSLPTEAQWEYACRAGSSDIRYGKLDKIAYYKDNSHGETRRVGQKRPNLWGLCDMLGNVREWCEDDWREGSSEDEIDPLWKGDSSKRVVRGSSYASPGEQCHCAYREEISPVEHRIDLGARLVLTPTFVQNVATEKVKAVFELGREEGLAAKVKIEGERERGRAITDLAKLLKSRFKADIDETKNKLKDKSLDELEALFDCALTCSNIDEFRARLRGFSPANDSTEDWSIEKDRPAGTKSDLFIAGVKYVFRWIPLRKALPGKIVHGFWIMSTPVTREMWSSVMEASPERTGNNQLPKERVSWKDCQAFISILKEKYDAAPEGLKFNLPTESQWELACLASNGKYGFGNIDEYAWHAGNSMQQAHPVALKKPNAWGLYDMLGNVWEWCADECGVHIKSDGKPSATKRRPLRGGSWFVAANCCRYDARNEQEGSKRGSNFGFRLILE